MLPPAENLKSSLGQSCSRPSCGHLQPAIWAPVALKACREVDAAQGAVLAHLFEPQPSPASHCVIVSAQFSSENRNASKAAQVRCPECTRLAGQCPGALSPCAQTRPASRKKLPHRTTRGSPKSSSTGSRYRYVPVVSLMRKNLALELKA